VESVRNSYIREFNRHLDDFCKNLPPTIYRRTVRIPYQNGTYERPLAIALVDISINTSEANCSNVLPLKNPPGFTKQLRVEGVDPISGNLLMFAYIFWSRKFCHAVISFTGTVFLSEWQSNFQYEQVAPTVLNGYQGGVLVHKGFYNIYLSIRDQLWNWWNSNPWVQTLYITGHSLGGALSTICAYDFANVFASRGGCDSQVSNQTKSDSNRDFQSQNAIDNVYPIHYSFAAPRSGNSTYARVFNRRLPTSLRINNTEDLIPQLPPATWRKWNYEQTGGNIPFTISLPTLSDDHIQAYIYHLPECAQVAPCHINIADKSFACGVRDKEINDKEINDK
ncbi:Class 3 lipase, partial [uncultured virus]